jgi:hypothetical protein
MDPHLNSINSNLDFNQWRQKVNKDVHESSHKVFSQTTLNHTGPIPTNRQYLFPGQKDYKVEYRFMAVSFSGEFNNLTIPHTRPLNQTNLILIIGQYTKNSDTLLLECNQYFVEMIASFFLLMCIAFIVFVNLFFTTLTVLIIKIDLVDPICELTYHIKNNKPADKEGLHRFIFNIKRAEYDELIQKESEKSKRRARIERKYDDILAKHKGDVEAA